MTDHKHPSAAVWITVALVAVLVGIVGYPLSEGPAKWLLFKAGSPNCLDATYDIAYAPTWWASRNGPEWLRDALIAYDQWWNRIIVDTAI